MAVQLSVALAASSGTGSPKQLENCASFTLILFVRTESILDFRLDIECLLEKSRAAAEATQVPIKVKEFSGLFYISVDVHQFVTRVYPLVSLVLLVLPCVC